MESVWDYPRPPALEPEPRRVRVVFGGVIVADSARALRVLETSHPPTIYVPPQDVRSPCLRPANHGGSWCEWKGRASYYDVLAGGRCAPAAAWAYHEPSAGYEALRDHLAFYPAAMDGCWLDDERVGAQEGDFYGGWITRDVRGPFKGAPGTRGW